MDNLALVAKVERRTPFGLFAVCFGVVLLVLLPVAYTLKTAASFGFDDAVELIFRPLVGELAINSLLIVVAATFTSAVIGTSVAWFVERTHLPGRRYWAVLAAVPLAVPPFITSYAWLSLSLSL